MGMEGSGSGDAGMETLVKGVLYCAVAVLVVRFVYRLAGGGRAGSAGGRAAGRGGSGGGEGEPELTVVFGTQTGTAQRFAKRLAEDVRGKLGLSVAVEDVENVDVWTLAERKRTLVFVVATYGDGEPSDSASEFHEWLMDPSRESDTSLRDLRFAVFGLGNSQYEKFNSMGKDVDWRLAALGGQRFLPIGLGDDNLDIEDDFAEWKGVAVAGIAELFGKELDVALDSQARPTHSVEFDGALAKEGSKVWAERVRKAEKRARLRSDPHPGCSRPVRGKIAAKRELHSTLPGVPIEREYLHVEIDTSGTGATFEAGDHIALHPENDPELVTALARRLGLSTEDLDRPLSVTPLEDGADTHFLPLTVSFRAAFSRWLDIQGHVSRELIGVLAGHCADPGEAARLTKMASHSNEGKAEFEASVLSRQYGLLEVLEEFPSCRPPAALVTVLVRELQPRYFSISNSPSGKGSAGTTVSVTVSLVLQEIEGRKVPFRGCATSWLSRLSIGADVWCHIRTTSFRLPRSPTTPVIMVGAGTGLAPYRGFLQERSYSGAAAEGGTCELFFGCRRPDTDFLYREELVEFKKEKVLTDIHTAFSREKPGVKDYVQNVLARQGDRVWEMLRRKGGRGYIYICGDAGGMARDVHNTLIEMCCRVENMGHHEAQSVLRDMALEGRLLKDVW